MERRSSPVKAFHIHNPVVVRRLRQGKAGQSRDGGDISRSTFQFMVPARSLPPSPLRALNEEDKHHERAEERT